MKKIGEFYFDDGQMRVLEIPEGMELEPHGICVVVLSGEKSPEFARFLCFREGGETSAGVVDHLADVYERSKWEGNQQAIQRVRTLTRKWMEEAHREMGVLRARFSVRRECLWVLLAVDPFFNTAALRELLAKRFQTHVEIQLVSPREITRAVSGLGNCGCRLCCSCGVVGAKQTVDVQQAKLTGTLMYDRQASGVCGRLKCCFRFD